MRSKLKNLLWLLFQLTGYFFSPSTTTIQKSDQGYWLSQEAKIEINLMWKQILVSIRLSQKSKTQTKFMKIFKLIQNLYLYRNRTCISLSIRLFFNAVSFISSMKTDSCLSFFWSCIISNVGIRFVLFLYFSPSSSSFCLFWKKGSPWSLVFTVKSKIRFEMTLLCMGMIRLHCKLYSDGSKNGYNTGIVFPYLDLSLYLDTINFGHNP